MNEYKHEYNEEDDVMTMILSENEIIRSVERIKGGIKHVYHVDARGAPVKVEIHEYSKFEKKADTRKPEVFKADKRDQTPLGSIQWEAFEKGRKEPVAGGSLSPVLGQSAIKVIGGDKSLVVKSLPLNEQFSLSVSDSVSDDEDEGSGFALQAERIGEMTFCWEWFVVDAEGHAKKLQESGELEFERIDIGGLTQFTRVKFLKDVSLRLIKMESQTDSPDWRVNIANSSIIVWPCLIDGEVRLPNSDAG